MRRRGCHHLTIMGKLTIIMDSYGASTKALEDLRTPYLYVWPTKSCLFIFYFFIVILFSFQNTLTSSMLWFCCVIFLSRSLAPSLPLIGRDILLRA
ncbi:hypothetical protein BDV41DRAFT_541901 [Aspergillus transmontanensis]|uniref:Uncharacterized protein n=1 Tax=Aspergillus transmontanensis TaxID=1034304 RepID=A0A5N6VSA7_9EURO|nr:hypothetical protein BDV41DRAFT_541901 [Aspergillus transmontanensis]